MGHEVQTGQDVGPNGWDPNRQGPNGAGAAYISSLYKTEAVITIHAT